MYIFVFIKEIRHDGAADDGGDNKDGHDILKPPQENGMYVQPPGRIIVILHCIVKL